MGNIVYNLEGIPFGKGVNKYISMMEWEQVEVKKVRIIINHTVSKLKSV